MSSFQCSPEQLANGASNALTIGGALNAHPVSAMPSGDLGHAAVTAALEAFRASWSGEFMLRAVAAQEAASLLTGAANDVARLDTLLAAAAARLGDPK